MTRLKKAHSYSTNNARHKNRRLIALSFCAALLSLLFSPQNVQAKGDITPVAEMGVALYTGATGKSMTGAFGYFADFRAETRRGFFRPLVAIELQSAIGKASIGTATPSATLTGSSFSTGTQIFVFQEGEFLPFVGASGFLSWYLMKLSNAPTGVEANTQSLSFGYELNAGVEIRTKSDGSALRIRTSYWKGSASLAGVSGLSLDSIRVTLGLSF